MPPGRYTPGKMSFRSDNHVSNHFISLHSFWCSRDTLNLTTTNQAILQRMGALCGFLGLCQVGSAIYVLVVMFSDKLLDRNAKHVDRAESASLETVPSLWNVNTFVFFAGE